MPEVVRGARASIDAGSPRSPRSPFSPSSEHRIAFSPDSRLNPLETTTTPLNPTVSNGSHQRSLQRHRSDSPRRREERDVYYDSRAGTQREFRRRGTTLQQYYSAHPDLLPQLPFTMHHGWRRWRLGLLIFIVIIDACVVPLVLYYGLTFGEMSRDGLVCYIPAPLQYRLTHFLAFAIVTTVWGGPTYLEFATRTWKLAIMKNNFYRPLGSNSRLACDITNWIFVLTIVAVTTLFIVGSAPHIVWLRVLSMPGPALLYCLGGCLFIQTMWSWSGRLAPFRVSSTPKGGKVYPGVYYFIEDIIAVNASAGRPYREALMARYEASPRFRRMIWNQSLFWSVPALIIAVVLTPIICVHTISDPVVYGLGWGIPFLWAGVWAPISITWAKKDLRRERETWEMDMCIDPSSSSSPDYDKNKAVPTLAPNSTQVPHEDQTDHSITESTTQESSDDGLAAKDPGSKTAKAEVEQAEPKNSENTAMATEKEKADAAPSSDI